LAPAERLHASAHAPQGEPRPRADALLTEPHRGFARVHAGGTDQKAEKREEMTTNTEGLRKAARRVFWEAKQIDQAAKAAREEALAEVITLLEHFYDHECAEMVTHKRDGYLYDVDDETWRWSEVWGKQYRERLSTLCTARILVEGRRDRPEEPLNNVLHWWFRSATPTPG
jgi:hypothetical protein